MKLREYQKEAINACINNYSGSHLLQLATGMGKEQPLSSLVLTEQGFKAMGEMQVGERIYSGDGTLTKVSGVYPQGIKPVYKITFSDKTSAECGLEHLWTIKMRSRTSWETITLRDIIDKHGLDIERGGRKNGWYYEIPITEIQGNSEEYFIKPYTLGVLIADGCLVQRSGICFSNSYADIQVKEKVESELPQGFNLWLNNHPDCPQYYFRRKNRSGKNAMKAEIERLKLNVKSGLKFIPFEYLYKGSFEQRKDLLAGLMDCDGCCVKNRTSYSTSSRQLAENVVSLVQSLGGIAKLHSYTRKNGKIDYVINVNTSFNPFHLQRKADKWQPNQKFTVRRYIKKIEYVRDEESQCIMVEADNHQYITNNYIVTHNTVIFSHIPRDGRTLVLANRKELVYQNGKYFDCDVDIEMANNRSGNAPVISASIQTMNTRYEQFAPDEFTSIYIDECHTTVGNGKSLEVLNYFKPKRIFGFTATPNRSQRGGLGHIFDDIIFERDVKWGIENGYLCPVECKRVNIGYDLTKVKTVKGDYAQGELSEEMEKEVNIQACVEAYHKHARGQTVIFTASVKQAHDIADRIDGAIAVSGKTPEKERKEILEAYERKEIKCICNCAVLTYGWDSPITETLLMMKPTQSSNLWIQMAGRALRLHPEKEKALIIDCVGVSNKPLCSSCTLIGIDESTVPERLREKLEGDILQLPDIVEQLADTPESWIRNVKIVDLFAKENKIKTQNLNVFLHADGRMIISLPERQKIIIPAPDLIGMVKVKDLTWIPREWEEFTKNKYGDKMPLQTAINAAKATLKKNYPNCSMIWDLTKAKQWGRLEPTEAQMRSIANKTKKKGLEIPQGINRLEASMILNRLNNK